MATTALTQSHSAQPEAPYRGMRSIGLTVRDIDATLAWYGAVLPVREVRRYKVAGERFGPELLLQPSGEVEIALAALPTGFLQLMRFAEGPEAPATPVPVAGPGYTHMCLQSPQAQAALPVMLGQGLELVSRCGPQGVDLGGYGVRYSYGRDREGRMLEIEHLDAPRRGERGWVTHLANVVHDLPRMTAFYRELFGKEPYRTLPRMSRPTFDDVTGYDGVAVEGCWFNLGNLEIEVWHYVNPPTPAPVGRRKLDEVGYNAPSFETADLDLEAARLAELGILTIGPEIDLGGWRTRYAADPEGNLFAIQQRDSAPESESVAGMTLHDPAFG